MDHRTTTRIRQARTVNAEGEACLIYLQGRRGPLVLADSYNSIVDRLDLPTLQVQDADGNETAIRTAAVVSVRATADVEDVTPDPDPGAWVEVPEDAVDVEPDEEVDEDGNAIA